MRLRQLHLYLGCFFAPLLLYFIISGMWQVFSLHKHPRDLAPTQVQSVLHALSNPHTEATLPGETSKDSASVSFRIFTEIMSIGFVFSALLGVQLALQQRHRRKSVVWSLLLGLLLPLVLLLIHH
ncbi:MAG: hypothetical protein ACXWP5_01010 [Bdellovibrionota bacterium]